LCAPGAEHAAIGEIGDEGLPLGGARRRLRLEAGLAHGLGDLAHFLSAAAAVLDHALEEIGALFLPVDAGKGLLERGQHRVLDAIGAGGGEAFDGHGLEALDHDTAHIFTAEETPGSLLATLAAKPSASRCGASSSAPAPPSSSGTLMR